MTQLLERAIAKARHLTEAEQDEAAELLLWAMGDSRIGAEEAASFDSREYGGHAGSFEATVREKA